jgi:predicted metal-dependent hydrolase
MLKQIILNNRQIDYDSRLSSRTRRLRLTVYGDGRLALTRPRWLSERAAADFMRTKADWILARLDHFKKFPSPLVAGPGRRADYLAQREAARSFITQRLEYFNQFYNFQYQRISIRDQKTRWGSCSRRGNLSFNYRLLNLPPEIADYVIVHELCHLQELNHSPRFWRLVAKILPDYDDRRHKLRNKIDSL